ncbi:MAG: tetratricopeptide repeat protein, partial [Blastocatellia bacterium]
DPAVWGGAHDLGALLAEHGRWKEALAVVDDVLRLGESESKPVASLLIWMMDEDDPLPTIERFLAEVPDLVRDDSECCLTIASAYLDSDKPTAALPFASRAIELASESSYAHATMANIRIAMKQYAEALAAAQCGLDLEPDATWSHYQLAVAYAHLGRHVDAMASLRAYAGQFKSTPSWLAKDVDLEPLYERPDFKALVTPSETPPVAAP